jgi:diaminopimelate decarboxylase
VTAGQQVAGPLPRSLLPDTASVDGRGRLSVGGVDVVDLAEEHGTPVFVYDEAHLRARCREAVAAFGDGVAYGSKAFLCLAMARLVHEEGMHLDVATGGELHVALAAGVPPERIVHHGNNKSVDELRRASELGIRVVADSFSELDRLEALADRTRVLVRVTPGVEAHTHEYVRTGQVDSKFGFGLESGDAAAGLTLYRVGTIKDIPGVRTYVSVDGGMSDNPRPVLYGSGYEAFLPRATTAERSWTATVVGKHCESGDVVVRDACLPADLGEGDVLCTPVTGAYGHSMASNYNKIPRPPVVFVADGRARVVVRRETYDDLLRLDL